MYFYDVKLTWRASVLLPRFQALPLLCLVRSANCYEFLRFYLSSCQVWLLEVNINPALHTNCQVLMDLLPGVVDETLSK